MANPFALPGTFLKGNLHLHTTNSDGQFAPQEAVDFYRDNGYDFLAITDHGHLTPPDDLTGDGVTLLPGMEMHPGTGELGQTHHIVGIGMETELEVPETDSLQEGLEYLSPLCRFIFIAHPYWTSVAYTDILGLSGHIGIEVFNYTCHCGIGRGDSGVQWDELLGRGERLLGLAVDDAHMHYWDACGGWIMVRATENTPEALIDAIIAGAFYASSGPAIEDVSFSDDRVTVRCSPCQAVNVISPRAGCGTTTRALERDGGPYTEVVLPVADAWGTIRVECVDERGRKAWTNPFWSD